MENDTWQDELIEKQRKHFVKILGQGEKIENLTASVEWPFFIEWIESAKAKLQKDMASDKFVNDHNGYIRCVGTIQALDMVINGVDKFKKAYEQAAKNLNKLNTQVDEAKKAK